MSQKCEVYARNVGVRGNVIELRCVEASAVPSNRRLELTGKSVTPFVCVKAAPLFPQLLPDVQAVLDGMTGANGHVD